MSQPAGIESGGQQSQGQQTAQQNAGTGQPQQQTQQQNGRPYDQYLQRIPEALRGTVEPIFQEWDANTTRRFQELNAQVQGYQDYQPIFDQYEPQAVQQAVMLAEALSDPQSAQEIFQSLAQVLGYQIEDDGSVSQNGDDEESGAGNPFSDPRFQNLEQSVGSIAEQLQRQQQQQQEEQLRSEVEREWNGLVESNKELFTLPDGSENEDAMDIVLGYAAANGGDLQAAVQKYAGVVGKQAAVQNQPGRSAPIVGGGAQNSLPQPTDLRKVDGKTRKDLALEVLRSANRQT